jgi:DNA-binding CsgD family transcriptional regulator
LRDISFQLKAKLLLKGFKSKLKHQKLKLTKAENALRSIIDFIPKERKRVKGQIQTAIEQLLLPLLEKLRSGVLNDTGSINLLENTIKKFTAVYGGEMANQLFQLTHKELAICNMIQQGFSSKDIASNLHLSTRTVENHRNSIRRKLGISRQHINLSGYLRKMAAKV